MQSTLFQAGRYNSAHSIRLLQSGPQFFSEAAALIHSAKVKLHVQFYAFVPDSTGSVIIQACKEAAKRGVAVKLLLDAFGSKEMKGRPLAELKKAGVECRLFSPIILYKLRTGRRLHHKIIVADEERAIVGGINISDKYKGAGGEAPWLDFALYLEGPVCRDVNKLCGRLFYGHPSSFKRKPADTTCNAGDAIPARVAHGDWFLKQQQVHHNLQQAIYFSKETVTIVCSYFIPGNKMIRLLKAAAARGVHVQLYMQGKSDILLARDAGRYWYRALLRHHISIYEFPARVLHGKLAIVDRQWLTLGSSNFNHLSNYTSIETNAEVYSPGFCSTVSQQLQHLLAAHAQEIAPQSFLNEKNPFRLFRWWLSWQLSKLLMYFLFRVTSKDS
jgi:cardiolipin synthase A/B